MAGEVKHQWNGSVLTVISDSGASSADLKGPKGDTGPRGPQGPAGVVYDENGELVIDLSIYYSKGEIDDMFNAYEPDLSNCATKAELAEEVGDLEVEVGNTYATKTELAAQVQDINNRMNNVSVDLTGYATEEYVDEQIVNVATGGTINLDNYYTKSEVDGIKVEADGKTIIHGENGIQTAIGGYIQTAYVANLNGVSIPLAASDSEINNIGVFTGIKPNVVYNVRLVINKLYTFNHTIMFTSVSDTFVGPSYKATFSGNSYVYSISYHYDSTYDGADGIWLDAAKDCTLTEFYMWTGDETANDVYVPIDGRFIPVDGTTITLNSEGKLESSGGTGANVDLSDYYTKDEVDEAIAANMGNEVIGNGCCVGNTDSSTATGAYAHASGYNTSARGSYSTAAGNDTEAIGECAIAGGEGTEADGDHSIAYGFMSITRGQYSHAEGYQSIANGNGSYVRGYQAVAGKYVNSVPTGGEYAHAEGYKTTAYGNEQFVHGRCNIPDESNTYAHIVGNGNDLNGNSNAYTLDWSGNAWFAGNVEGTALILMSPNGTRYQITVNDSGVLNAVSL